MAARGLFLRVLRALQLVSATRERQVAPGSSDKLKGSSRRSTKDLLQHNNRYTEPEAIWAALQPPGPGEEAVVRLVRMSWLLRFYALRQKKTSSGMRLPRRQEMPEEAFIDVAELKEMYGEGNTDGLLPIVAVSHCWLTPAHPDPDCDSLRVLCRYLREQRAAFAEFGFPEVGVFMDWVSLWQRNTHLWRNFMYRPVSQLTPKQVAALEAYQSSRTPAENASFLAALKDTMDLWYAHHGTTVVLLTELPPRFEGRRPQYNDAGWTTYERCCAELIKEQHLDYAEWRLVQVLLQLSESRKEWAFAAAARRATSRRRSSVDPRRLKRRWPVGPDDFEALVQQKTFTNGSDAEVVTALYRQLSTEILGGARTLDFEGMPPPSDADGARLGRCLNLCTRCVSLDLQSIRMGDACSVALFSALDADALPALTNAQCNDNDIGDAGMAALAAAFTRGAMPALRRLHKKQTEETMADLVKDGINYVSGGLNLAQNPGDTGPVWRAIADAM